MTVPIKSAFCIRMEQSQVTVTAMPLYSATAKISFVTGDIFPFIGVVGSIYNNPWDKIHIVFFFKLIATMSSIPLYV